MPVKYQPDYIYLRHVKILRVHLFTFIQVICFVVMWVIKSIKETSITFPVMVNIACNVAFDTLSETVPVALRFSSQ